MAELQDKTIDEFLRQILFSPRPVSVDSQQNHNLQAGTTETGGAFSYNNSNIVSASPSSSANLTAVASVQQDGIYNSQLVPSGAPPSSQETTETGGGPFFDNHNNVWASPSSSVNLTAVAPQDGIYNSQLVPHGAPPSSQGTTETGGGPFSYNNSNNVCASQSSSINLTAVAPVQQEGIYNSQLVSYGAPPSSQGTLNDRPASRSRARLDDGVPSIIPYLGPYKFWCAVVGATSADCVYSMERDKLYVKERVTTEFQFTYNFEKVIGSEMLVEAFVRYEKPDAAKIPVKRCSIHTELEKQALKETKSIDEKLIPHFMKCLHEGAHHFQDENQRHRVQVELGQPQPGSNHVSRNFRFDCLTTCSKYVVPQKSQSYPMVLVYELKERKPNQQMWETVGRRIIKLQVCTYPKRDSRDKAAVDKSSGNRKMHTPETSGHRPKMEAASKENMEVPAKKSRMDIKKEPLTPTRDSWKPCNFGELAQLDEKALQDALEDNLCEQVRYVVRAANTNPSPNMSLIRNTLSMNVSSAYQLTKSEVGPGPNPK